MKAIIGSLIYDTDKAEKIYSYKQQRKTGHIGDFNFYEWYTIEVYKTEKGNYFIYGYVKDKPNYSPFIEEFTECELKNTMKKLNPEKYIEMYQEELEEA